MMSPLKGSGSSHLMDIRDQSVGSILTASGRCGEIGHSHHVMFHDYNVGRTIKSFCHAAAKGLSYA